MKIALLTTDNRQHYRDYEKPEPYFGTAPEALLQGFEQLPDLEVHVVSCTRRPMKSPDKLAPNIFFHSVVVPKIGWMRTLYQGCIRATRKKLQEIQPAIVHGQGTEGDCGICAVFSGFPSVLTIHGNMGAVAKFYHARPGSYLWMAARLEKFTIPRTQGVFCNSSYTRQQVTPRAKQTWLVPNAIRMDFFGPPVKTPTPARPILLNIGVVQPYKRQLELLEVARRLHQRGLQFEIRFVGAMSPQTAYGAAFEQKLRDAEAGGYARHVGPQSTSQLIRTIDEASALVHFPGEEAFGLVVAEALARNRKFFGAATGGIIDIASQVDGAELYRSGDFDALEEGLVRWLVAGAPLPREAASVMRQRYHPEVVARRHLEIYREVLSR
jgi:glycosyltransferase involved in cell wall biosynthesis